MNEKEQQDMNLEEILKEFAQPETEEEQQIAAESEEMEAFLEEQQEAEEKAEILREELAALQTKVADMGDTIRLDTIAAVLGSQMTEEVNKLLKIFKLIPHAARQCGIPRRFREGENGDGINEARDAQAAPIRV